MPPKVSINPTKSAAILNYIQASGVAHSIKDLEKALPSVGSISSMAVKDYLSDLTDEGKVKIEKIGSINWWWSFPGEEKQKKELAIAKMLEDKEKAACAVAETQASLDAMKAIQEDNTALVARADVSQSIEKLEYEIRTLTSELEAYSGNDPRELEILRNESLQLEGLTGQWTDQILEMERYLWQGMGLDKSALVEMKRELYGDEYDEEDGGLKEL